MAKEYRVFGGNVSGNQRIFTAAYTKKAAYEAFCNSGLYWGSYTQWDKYVTETFNHDEVRTALTMPGKVFRASEIEPEENPNEVIQDRLATLENMVNEFIGIFDTAAFVENDHPHADWAMLAREIHAYRDKWMK